MNGIVFAYCSEHIVLCAITLRYIALHSMGGGDT